ncbi:lytic transglycosylase domain-containing protein [Methylocystis heyeri]|uniref:Transglycosylase SLT domain-containing protein n=1 Tax=Methylocystis heyeri TaxID=391905 RepID=A0A6B8KHZ8_9HYPH|nr:lytic transglycosylase domain-containing protein [Methylocystis heyeri]QGM47229.1 transglycosylase SLT domain-containing protein [Methylocystis heyeri]
MTSMRIAAAFSLLVLCGCNATGRPDYMAEAVSPEQSATPSPHEALDRRISHYARTYRIPESLVHAVVQRESKYNPEVKHGPFWGLMQIRHETARSMGYSGPARGLLDPETNLTYATAYLANAYRVAQGDERRAIRLYAGGYYYEAKRQGLLGELHSANDFGEFATASVADDAPAR